MEFVEKDGKDFHFSITEEWSVVDGKPHRRVGYVARFSMFNREIVLRRYSLLVLLHELGHVLLAITNEHHHGGE